MFELIVSQGRIADRKERTIEGALQTARMLEDALGSVDIQDSQAG